MNYCENPYRYQRRVTREVMVGRIGIGGANPIRVQSMITCDTMDTEASIAQTMELAEAGCEIVRITAAHFGCHGDFARQFGKDARPFGVNGAFEMFDLRPLAVSGHTKLAL